MYQTKDSVFIIGIGNEYRSDDAAGLMAAGRIRDLGLPGVNVVESDGDGMGLMDLWFKRKNVIIIDAVSSGSPAGKIHILNAGVNIDLPENLKFSTHSFGVLQALKLSANLGILPENIIIIGIEGFNFAGGRGLSPHVARALNNIESLVHKEVLKLQSNIKEKSINGPAY